MSVDTTFLKKTLLDLITLDTQTCQQNNKSATDYIVNICRDNLNLETEVYPYSVNSKKVNILAYKKIGFTTLLNGHIDTVDVGKESTWNYPPFGKEVVVDDETRIYGRGSCDMKCGLATIFSCFKTMIENGKNIDDIALFITCEEEIGLQGCTDFLRHHKSKLSSVKTIIITEPTGLQVGESQNGCLWVNMKSFGKAAHGCNIASGVNAIDAMMDLNYVLKEAMQRNMFVEDLTMNIGTIKGGEQVNIVPDECIETIDFRFTPKLNAFDVRDFLDDVTRQMNDISMAQYEYSVSVENSSFICKHDNHILLRLKEYLEKNGELKVNNMLYCTDGSILKKMLGNVDIIIYGPGDTTLMHKPNEYVVFEDVIKCSEALVNILS
ncbi:Acetylornithine deacetylase [Entamoeba marina]